MLSKYLLPVAVLALTISGASNVATWAKLSAERKAHQSFRLKTAEADTLRSETARIAEAGHRAKERTQAETLQAITQKATDEKNRLAADLQRALDGLRNRPERPAAAGGAVPPGAADPVACTGAQLYRPDGEFLARESARADGLRLQLAACQAAYDAAVILTAPDHVGDVNKMVKP
jgi:hypothetical protein